MKPSKTLAEFSDIEVASILRQSQFEFEQAKAKVMAVHDEIDRRMKPVLIPEGENVNPNL